jgi:SAM-dependent methyltransferase
MDTKEQVREFWNSHPCGSQMSPLPEGLAFFLDYEAKRYALEPHILEVVPFAAGRNRDVLEIGCGLGTDGTRWAQAGARYTGIDLTAEAVRLTSHNFNLRGLQGRFLTADAEQLRFPDASFDIVYSHGVIHHTPRIEKTVAEIHRVLRPGGKAIVMVYHRHSYNYYGNILLLRRLGAMLLALPGGLALARLATGESPKLLAAHREALRREGLAYLATQRFLTANTDGPWNPLSRVHSQSEARALFSGFRRVSTEVRYLNRRRLPLLGRWLPESWHAAWSRRWGWHLYIFAEK